MTKRIAPAAGQLELLLPKAPAVVDGIPGQLDLVAAIHDADTDPIWSLPVKRVSELVDGDVFSVDGGQTWHRCFCPLWGDVSCYLPGSDSLNYRVIVGRDEIVLLSA